MVSPSGVYICAHLVPMFLCEDRLGVVQISTSLLQATRDNKIPDFATSALPRVLVRKSRRYAPRVPLDAT